ncbi:hypothetical protein WME76_13245 [Sorangium sp. So ce119]|uniref:hypothetical protein n=1 Tax=Sorangium sp. So ce119 TaxID=3133279 RepID=UPI003F5F2A3F
MPDRERGPVPPRATLLFIAAAGLAAAGCEDFRHCDAPDPARQSALPAALSQTGLYADIAAGTVASDAVAYEPGFELWSDGAEKRRFIRLPPGAQIDTADQDAWQFPEGTHLWKEFRRDGVLVETRVLARVGSAPEDWAALAYVWNADGTDALATPGGAVDARGTPHDVPAAAECMGCHGGTEGRVLGFSAIQLAASPGEVDLDEVVARGMLSEPPPTPVELPGDAVARAALGWLHANCSHCHNKRRPESDGARCYDPYRSFDLTLRVGDLASVEATATYRTAVGSVIDPGDPEESDVVERARRRDPDWPSMPPLGTEVVDEAGLAALRAWIRGL